MSLGLRRYRALLRRPYVGRLALGMALVGPRTMLPLWLPARVV